NHAVRGSASPSVPTPRARPRAFLLPGREVGNHPEQNGLADVGWPVSFLTPWRGAGLKRSGASRPVSHSHRAACAAPLQSYSARLAGGKFTMRISAFLLLVLAGSLPAEEKLADKLAHLDAAVAPAEERQALAGMVAGDI